MNKYILTGALSLASLFACAQTQIPNGDFENWSSLSICGGGDSLDHFSSATSAIYYNYLINYNIKTCPDDKYTIKTTDKQSGNYALRLGAVNYEGTPFSNIVILGPIDDYSEPADGSINGGSIPFTGRPTKLTGYYKFDQGYADELNIELWGSNDEDEDYLFHGIFTTSSGQSTYKKFEIDLDYNEFDQSDPKILSFYISIGNTDENYVNAKTVAFVDNLVFEYDDVTTSTVKASAASPVNVFAAQKNINFSQQVSDITVSDMLGAQRIAQHDATKVLNANALNTGLYIVTYKYNDAYFSKKVMIE